MVNDDLCFGSFFLFLLKLFYFLLLIKFYFKIFIYLYFMGMLLINFNHNFYNIQLSLLYFNLKFYFVLYTYFTIFFH